MSSARSRREHLPRDPFKRFPRHSHKPFAAWRAQLSAFGGGWQIALHKYVAFHRQHCRWTKPALAQQRLRAVFTDNLLNGHIFWMVMKQFTAFCFISGMEDWFA